MDEWMNGSECLLFIFRLAGWAYVPAIEHNLHDSLYPLAKGDKRADTNVSIVVIGKKKIYIYI